MVHRGFTLIELLVVVAIISLLSSVVLVSVNEGRAKGRNAQRLQILSEYRKALELSRDATGQYPATGAYRCLGNPPDGVCMYNRLVVPAIVDALTPYFPSGLPLAPESPNLPGYDGMQYYTCPGPGACTTYPTNNGYGILWHMEGNTGCGPGTGTYNTTYNIMSCIYVHY